MCMFKALHKDSERVEEQKTITGEEFYSFYEVQGLRWKQVQLYILYAQYLIQIYHNHVSA